jgi:hypothetical protein
MVLLDLALLSNGTEHGGFVHSRHGINGVLRITHEHMRVILAACRFRIRCCTACFHDGWRRREVSMVCKAPRGSLLSCCVEKNRWHEYTDYVS